MPPHPRCGAVLDGGAGRAEPLDIGPSVFRRRHHRNERPARRIADQRHIVPAVFFRHPERENGYAAHTILAIRETYSKL